MAASRLRAAAPTRLRVFFFFCSGFYWLTSGHASPGALASSAANIRQKEKRCRVVFPPLLLRCIFFFSTSDLSVTPLSTCDPSAAFVKCSTGNLHESVQSRTRQKKKKG